MPGRFEIKNRLKDKVKIYTCSSVGIDYFFFLGKAIQYCGYEVSEVFLITEEEYRRQARSHGFDKFRLRFKMYITYPLMLIKKALTAEKGAVFIVSSNTFYAPLIVRLFLNKNAHVVNLVYDLFPDAIEVAGKLKSNSLLSLIIGNVVRQIFNKSDVNVFLGNTLKKHALNRWAKDKNKLSRAIPIAADFSLFENDFPIGNYQKSQFVFHYGGQLGHLHDADNIIKFIDVVKNEPNSGAHQFAFNLSGANAEYLKNKVEYSNVKIEGAIPSNLWREKIKNYQIGIVSLSPGGASVCLPSKTYSMMGGGLAIIAICPIWSDLADLVLSLDSGWVINNSFYNSFEAIPVQGYLKEIKRPRSSKEVEDDMLKLIIELNNNPALIENKRKNAFFGVRQNYNLNEVSGQWKELLLKF